MLGRVCIYEYVRLRIAGTVSAACPCELKRCVDWRWICRQKTLCSPQNVVEGQVITTVLTMVS